MKGVETVATRRVNHPHASPSRRPPATTPEARENQLIAQAVDLAAKQLADGTASAQVITHFLKLGSSTEKLDQLKKQHEVELLEAKKEAMASGARTEELMRDALNAFRSYSGQTPEDVDDDDDDYDD